MRNNKGQFIKGSTLGQKTWFTSERSKGNQHAKGNPKNRTTFGVKNIDLSNHPCWKGGLQWTKRDGYMIALGKGKRTTYAKWLWEQVYGPVPKGHVIRHVDGNKKNNEYSNLECISRADLMRLNSRIK